MHFPVTLRILLPVLMSAGAACAAPQDDAALVRVLTCSLQADTSSFSGASDALKGRTTEDGRGGMRMAGPVRLGDLCIQDAHIAAAFGVLTVAASVCDGKAEPLLAFVRGAVGGLAAKSVPQQQGMVAAYEAPKYSLAVFHGEPGFPPAPDASSKRLSYMCGYAASGPQ